VEEATMSAEFGYEISYGKLQVPLYRVYGRPLEGLATIPESAFTGRANTLVGMEVDVEVFGENFLPAYTHGDNSNVVATDSMKNIVLRQALAYNGATQEGFLYGLGRHFLTTYSHMERLRLMAREMPFAAAQVRVDGVGFGASDRVYSLTRGDYATAALDFQRDGDGQPVLTSQRSGRTGMLLLKVTGSAFTRFVRDDYTTLPERGDRPLFIALDVFWEYANPLDMLADPTERYVAAEQVRDLVQVVFHEMVSESIQHLVHEMGQRLLVRFPQLAAVSFTGQNRTPDPMAVSETDPKVKVYSTPFPAYGLIKLTVRRNESRG
jgi:urate oxidase